MAVSEPQVRSAAAAAPRSWYRWELLAFCWLAYFLNRADRQIYSAVLPDLRASLGLSPDQAGLVAMCFTWAYGAMVPLAGYLGDRWRRKWIVVASLLFWSGATVLTGFAGGLLALVVVRGLATGGGEAMYYPSANSLIGQWHERTRALAMSIHQTSVYVGVVAGSWMAGWIGMHYGWRAAFGIFGCCGVVLAGVAAWRLHDTPQPAAAREQAGVRMSEALRLFAQRPSLILLTVAFAGQVFVESGYLLWMPTFLQETFAQKSDVAGLTSTLFHFVAAFGGVMLGATITDRLAPRRPNIRIDVEYIGQILAAPFILLMAWAEAPWVCYVGLAGFGLFRGIYDSNLFAAPFDIIPVRFRSSVVGIMLCGAFLVGATSPYVLGWMKNPLGLRWGLVVLAVVYLLAGLASLAARLLYFPRDHQLNRREELAA